MFVCHKLSICYVEQHYNEQVSEIKLDALPTFEGCFVIDPLASTLVDFMFGHCCVQVDTIK